jgi:tetratricopeptide (TPR) repeat protein
VTGSVVLGDVIQIRDVGGNVSVTLSRPVYRVEGYPAARFTLTVEQARAQPSRLLLARYELVPFAGRANLLTELSGWLGEAEPTSVRLIYGPGGQGKSRLAAQFARHHAAGWTAWQARQAPPVSQRPARIEMPVGAGGLLVVVDYADRWPPSHLQAMITDMHVLARRLPEPLPLRVLLLTRTAGFWWEALEQRLDTDYGIPAAADVLQPLGGEVDRAELFAVAWRHFAAAMDTTGAGRAGPIPTPPSGLGEPGFGQVLTVHMAALAAADAHRHGETAPADPARVSAYLLKRERAHWQQWHARAEDPLPTPPQVMSRAVYTATLTGPMSQAQGIEVLVRARVASVPDNASQILDDHHKYYPPENPATVLEPLYPDRLGEDFIALTTPRQSPGATPSVVTGPGDPTGFADAWAATAIPGLLVPAAAEERPATWSGPAIAVLIETARRWRHIASDQLYPLLNAHPQLILHAGGPALISLVALPGVDLTLLETIEAQLPRHRHVDLDAGIAALTARLADHRLTTSNDPAEHAHIYHELGVRLRNAGLHQQALPATRNAIQTRQQLAAADRNAYLPGLADSLNNYALELADVGQRAEAAAVSEQAVELRRELAALNRDAYLPDLAMSLNNHALRLAESGRRAEAAAVSEQAVELRRELAALNRDAYLPDLAMSLNNHAVRLAESGRRAQAATLSQEAVDLHRELAALNRDAYLPDLAMSLNNHAPLLAELGRRAEAFPFSEQAVKLGRELAALNRDAYLPDLADSLTNHAALLAEVGRRAEAVPLSQEAVDLYTELARQNRDAYLPRLAASLHNHAALLAEAGRRAEAFRFSEQAVELRRELAALNRDAYLPDLATSLANHAQRLAGAGRRAEAFPFSEQAVKLRRELAALNRDAYLPGLAGSLIDHAALLAGMGRRAEAVPVSLEALDLHLELAALNRDAYLPGLATSLNNHGALLAESGRWTEAFPFSELAVKLRRELARKNRDAYLPVLATSLNNYAGQLAELGRRAEAVPLSQEAVDLHRELARQNRDAYLPDLAMSLNNHALLLAELGRRAEAVPLSQEAVDLHRELARQNRDAYLPRLAMSLSNHASRLAEVGQPTAAVSLSQEAAGLYAELTGQNREA